MLECVINISEGRRLDVVDAIAAAAGPNLLDVHRDPDHHRSVLTLAGDGVEQAARRVAEMAVEAIDLTVHAGAHPRLGAVDVVPFVPLTGSTMGDAVRARDEFGRWAADALSLPCFLYGPERSLPDVRRRAFIDLDPDFGPTSPHPRAGACAVGARPILVAYNVWVAAPVADAREVASRLRSPSVRALGLVVGARAQVSFNLIDPHEVGPADAYDAVTRLLPVEGAELVGLVPRAILDRVEPDRWAELDLGPDRTIEARLEQAGLDGGRL